MIRRWPALPAGELIINAEAGQLQKQANILDTSVKTVEVGLEEFKTKVCLSKRDLQMDNRKDIPKEIEEELFQRSIQDEDEMSVLFYENTMPELSESFSRKEEEFASIEHPQHYTRGKYEVFPILQDWFPTDPLAWQVGKYLARYKHKGTPLEDLKKAEFYLKELIKNVSDTN